VTTGAGPPRWPRPAQWGQGLPPLGERPRWIKWAARHKILTSIGLLLAVFVVVGVASPTPRTTTQSPESLATPLATSSPQPALTTTQSPTTPPAATPSPTAAPSQAGSLQVDSAAGVARPDRTLTPGSALAAVTTAQLCTAGYSATVRNVPEEERRSVFTAYGLAYPPAAGAYELDHLVALELGGDNSTRNLWPQPTGPLGAAAKDQLENKLHDQVCSGAMALPNAQQAMATNWYSAWQQYVGAKPTPVRTTAAPPAIVAPPLSSAGGSAYYANCAAARAAGAAPLHRGEPGYRAGLDRDSDGIACE